MYIAGAFYIYPMPSIWSKTCISSWYASCRNGFYKFTNVQKGLIFYDIYGIWNLADYIRQCQNWKAKIMLLNDP